MRILITNDDGIHSPGLAACLEIARTLSEEVWIVAPEIDQSGVSHSLSLNDPLRMREVGERHFAVKGTPTDCVIMGVRHLMKAKPDLVLSGWSGSGEGRALSAARSAIPRRSSAAATRRRTPAPDSRARANGEPDVRTRP